MADPGIEDLFDRYPELAEADENRTRLVLEEAAMLVGDGWIPRYRNPAILALAAHMLISEGALGGGALSAISGGETSGPIVSESVGPLSVRYKGYNSRSSDTAGAISSASGISELDSTPYGLRFLEYRSYSFPAAIAII